MRHFAYIRLHFPIVKSEFFRLLSWRWTRVFVPLSDSFPRRWTAGKQAVLLVFTAWLTPWKQIVFRCFVRVFGSQNGVLTGVYGSFLAFSRTVNARRMRELKTACSSAFTSWLTLKKHGVFLEENLEFDTYTPTFVPFLHFLLLHFDGILHALWKLLGGVVSKFSYVFIYSEFVAVPLLSQWHANDSILLTEGLDSLPDYVPSNKI